jgi:hypothetical protein
VLIKKARYSANKFCLNNGMKLYDPSSSDAAFNKASNFFESTYRRFSKLSVLVDGKNNGKCQVFKNSGDLSSVNCKTAYNFACEFVRKENENLLPDPGTCGIETENRIVGGINTGLKG